jgi:hypothetical protein
MVEEEFYEEGSQVLPSIDFESRQESGMKVLVRIDEVTHYNTQNKNYDTDNAPNNDGP